ncbi:hypothetical protein [Hymenobacter terrestris]|uniref:STAS/SEC14 domain-containing protein n=1 Tax=Hymenobacter terrestris TaxID=2748310 RepID=A0ABX2Q5D1_9BACT|nr:hypothetical protein [Hymenobacter terrestris]NVO86181.1 hypothetical protein [Hymenobacter terrestris]
MLPSIELPSRTLSFRTDLNILVVRWHPVVETLAAVQADYAQMLASAKAHGLSAWLLDVRRRQVAALELGPWVNTTFYPEAVARLAPQRLRVAVLSSPALTAAYTTNPGHQKEVAYALDPARPFDMALFEDEGRAMQWLGRA